MIVKKVMCVIGTRPEAIKMAPVINLLLKDDQLETFVVATAQHREMLDQVLKLFKITPDIDLDIMSNNQSTIELLTKLAPLLKELIQNEKPDCVIAQGDTTTLFVTSMVSFYCKVPFFHVEAGLRTGNIKSPFPEEMHRIISDRLATLNFAPTEYCKQALLRESIAENTIHVTGNTVVDALLHIEQLNLPHNLNIDPNMKLILITGHRRDNFGKPLQEICDAAIEIVNKFSYVQVLYPVHPNPNVKQQVHEKLAHHDRILLTPPLKYDVFVAVMKASYLIITDSGGIQEEAPVLGKPMFITRKETERMEVVEAGGAKLCELNAKAIYESVATLLQNKNLYESMAKRRFIYGDGQSANKIVNIIKQFLLENDF